MADLQETEQTATTRRAVDPRSPGRGRASFSSIGLPVLLAVTVLFGLVAVPNFASTDNLRAILLSASLVGIVAVGLSLMTITGSIFSLAIPSSVGVGSIVFAQSMTLGVTAAVCITIVACGAIGAVQGYVIGYRGADPILTTLATGAILLGAGQLATNGRIVFGPSTNGVFQKEYFGVPGEVLIFVVVAIAVDQFYRRTRIGREMRLTGLNEAAARIAGVRVAQARMLALLGLGVCIGLAASLISSRSDTGSLVIGESLAFAPIVAVVIGGIAVSGGVGRPLFAAIGAVFVATLANILLLAGFSYAVQLTVQGAVVLAVVIVPAAWQFFRARRRQ